MRHSKKVRLTVTDSFLKEHYGLEEGSVLKVIQTVHHKTRTRFQVRLLYSRRTKVISPKIDSIWVTDQECVFTTYKLTEL